MILECDGQELPAPVSLKVDDEILWSSATGRTLDGTMLGDVVAEKKTLYGARFQVKGRAKGENRFIKNL